MENNDNKQSKKNRIFAAVIFLCSLIVLVVIAMVEFGGDQDRSIEVDTFHWGYLAGAVVCFLTALFSETAKYTFLLWTRGFANKTSLGFSTAVIGRYYDNLTPSCIGGQAFQIYHLSTHGCDAGTSGSLPVLGFLGSQFSLILIGIAVVIGGSNSLGDLVVIRVMAIVGVIFMAFVPLCVVLFSIAPHWLETIVGCGTHLLGKIHILKDPSAVKAKVITSLRSYNDALHMLGRRRWEIVVVGLLSLLYQLAFISLPYFVLKFFGADIRFVPCFCMITSIILAMAVIITPGGSGVAEISFYMIFNNLPGGEVFWGMLLWRLLYYYSWIILGAVVQLRDQIRSHRTK